MPNDGVEYLLQRHPLADGEVTTLYAVKHPAGTTRARAVHFEQPEQPAPASRRVVSALALEAGGR